MKKKFVLLFILLNMNIVFSNDVLQLGAVIPKETVEETMKVLIVAAKDLNYDVEVITLPGQRALKMSDAGKIDGEVARIFDIDKIYTNLIRVPETVLELNYYVYSYKDHELKNLDEFFESDLKLLHILGIKFTEGYKNKIGEDRFLETSKMLNALRRVAIGRGDIVIANDLEVMEIFKNNKIEGLVKSKDPITSLKLYPYLHKKHKDLVKPLAEAMKKYKNNTSK